MTATMSSFVYEACDIPARMTITEFRARRCKPRRPDRRLTRLIRSFVSAIAVRA
jgi:hypothetical protein